MPIPVVSATDQLFKKLEKRGLIRRLLPTKKTLKTKKTSGLAQRIYRASSASGSHGLFCIAKRSVKVKLRYHSDNEEFMLIKPYDVKYKPLYLVIALDLYPIFKKKAVAGKIGPKDFLAINCEYNHPLKSFFTMNKYAVHGEMTAKGAGQHPVFYVSEPCGLSSKRIQGKQLDIRVQGVN